MKPFLISFSGIDGAGKSTQIDKFLEYLASRNIAVTLLTFWDHAAVLPHIRSSFSRRILQSDGQIGTPDKPARRRDKNAQTLPLLLGRSILHLLDVLHLRRVVRTVSSKSDGIIIFDRYIYDQLAALPMSNRLVRAYARVLLRIAPVPALAYLLDADPMVARARKPEYPLEFMRKYRSSYLELRHIAGLRLIAPSDIVTVHEEILRIFNDEFHKNAPASQTETAAVA